MEMGALLAISVFSPSDGHLKIGADCNTVVLGHPQMAKLADDPKCLHGGMWRAIEGALSESNCSLTIFKVKAHQAKKQVSEEGLPDYFGNEFADEWAKRGASDRSEW